MSLPGYVFTVWPRNMPVGGCFESLLPYFILDIKDFFQFISLTNSFTQIYITLKSIFYKMTAMFYLLLFSFVSKNLTNYGRRHLKLFTNCHVSWDTMYIITLRLKPFQDMKCVLRDEINSKVKRGPTDFKM